MFNAISKGPASPGNTADTAGSANKATAPTSADTQGATGNINGTDVTQVQSPGNSPIGINDNPAPTGNPTSSDAKVSVRAAIAPPDIVANLNNNNNAIPGRYDILQADYCAQATELAGVLNQYEAVIRKSGLAFRIEDLESFVDSIQSARDILEAMLDSSIDEPMAATMKELGYALVRCANTIAQVYEGFQSRSDICKLLRACMVNCAIGVGLAATPAALMGKSEASMASVLRSAAQTGNVPASIDGMIQMCGYWNESEVKEILDIVNGSAEVLASS